MKTLLALALLAFVFTGCKKSEDSPTIDTMLRAHKWHQDSYWVNGQSTPLMDCAKDDYMIFGDGSTGYQDFGTKLCYPSIPAKLNFNWNVSPDQKYITLMQNGNTVNYKVISIDQSALEVEWLVTPNTFKYRFLAE